MTRQRASPRKSADRHVPPPPNYGHASRSTLSAALRATFIRTQSPTTNEPESVVILPGATSPHTVWRESATHTFDNDPPDSTDTTCPEIVSSSLSSTHAVTTRYPAARTRTASTVPMIAAGLAHGRSRAGFRRAGPRLLNGVTQPSDPRSA